jgi:hypothetical protein
MIDTIELRIEVWEKLHKFHELLGGVLFETENLLDSLLHIGVYPPLKPKAEELHRKIFRLVAFLEGEKRPFGITVLSKR